MIIVSTPVSRGTAILISPTLLVTAGHVVQPYHGTLISAEQIRLRTTEGDLLHPAAIRVHPRWANAHRRDSDIALLRLDHSLREYLITAIEFDAIAHDRQVSVNGFDGDGTEITNDGAITRFNGEGGFDVFVSSDLTFPDGMSGGGLVDDQGTAIGLATWSPEVPAPNSFIGIPFLDATLGWLRVNL